MNRGTLLKTLLPMFAIAATILISGCNTMEGAGEDMQDAGEAVENQADGS